MAPALMLREPLVITFEVPMRIPSHETVGLIDRWYTSIADYDFVYLGGTSFALNPPCPEASVLEARLSRHVGNSVTAVPLTRYLQTASETVPIAP